MGMGPRDPPRNITAENLKTPPFAVSCRGGATWLAGRRRGHADAEFYRGCPVRRILTTTLMQPRFPELEFREKKSHIA